MSSAVCESTFQKRDSRHFSTIHTIANTITCSFFISADGIKLILCDLTVKLGNLSSRSNEKDGVLGVNDGGENEINKDIKN